MGKCLYLEDKVTLEKQFFVAYSKKKHYKNERIRFIRIIHLSYTRLVDKGPTGYRSGNQRKKLPQNPRILYTQVSEQKLGSWRSFMIFRSFLPKCTASWEGSNLKSQTATPLNCSLKGTGLEERKEKGQKEVTGRSGIISRTSCSRNLIHFARSSFDIPTSL